MRDFIKIGAGVIAGASLMMVAQAVAQPGIPGWGGRSSDDRMTCDVRHQDSRDRDRDRRDVIWLSISCR